MTRAICVYGLWHLGCVTAACLAAAGFDVVGLDPDEQRIADLRGGRPPIAEPQLDELIRDGLRTGRLAFTADAADAVRRADTVWVAFDTPVDEGDRSDAGWVRARVDRIQKHVRPHTLILVSSQVPVGFTAGLERAWQRRNPTLQFAYSPENLRLGRAIDAFRRPDRVIVGMGGGTRREIIAQLFAPFCERIDWMSLGSAEMTKHALNGFLALSAAYANELARICEQVGADALDVERGLRSDPRVGAHPYLSPGLPIAGGTLLRDVTVLDLLAREHGIQAPLVEAIQPSNRLHQAWTRERVEELLRKIDEPKAAILGLTYRPGTDTLRRSSALELSTWLAKQGVRVAAYDPAIRDLPAGFEFIHLAQDLDEVLSGADVVVLATAWPEFRSVDADRLARQMRHLSVVDQAGFLPQLADDPRVTYVRVGRTGKAKSTNS